MFEYLRGVIINNWEKKNSHRVSAGNAKMNGVQKIFVELWKSVPPTQSVKVNTDNKYWNMYVVSYEDCQCSNYLIDKLISLEFKRGNLQYSRCGEVEID